MKKKYIGVSFLVLILVLLSAVFIYVKNDSKSAEVDYMSHDVIINLDDGFTLGIIGDSWVNQDKLDIPIQETLESQGIISDVISFSLPGHKSGEVYEDMLVVNDSFNSNDILNDDKVDAILIVVGVNDTAGHIGSDYYVQNVKNIISYANSKNKFVYVLEIPEYGIEEDEKFLSALKHNLYKFINDGGKTNVIKDYRSELKHTMKQSSLKGFTIINYPEELDDYHSIIELYKDQFHLNDEGSASLGQMVGEEIANDISE